MEPRRKNDHAGNTWRAEIISAGREVLAGHTLDTNAHWLCRQISRLGGSVARVVVVDDDAAAIAREVRFSLKRRTEAVITTGGLGPTADDRTLEGIAGALGRKLVRHPRASRWVKAFYRDLVAKGLVRSSGSTSEREKMAILPRGSTPLRNPCGAAPGVMLEEKHSLLFCLPGVPKEMRAIFAGSVEPTLRRVMGKWYFLEEELATGLNDETEVALAVKKMSAKFPDVYFKSLPERFGRDISIRVRLSLRGTNRRRTELRLDQAVAGLKKALEDHSD